MSMHVGINFCETPGCCGVTQVADFTEEALRPNRLINGTGRSLKVAYQDLFESLVKYIPDPNEYGPVFQMWFQKNSRYDGTFDDVCQAEDLRLLVETIEGCVFLGEFVNPNSGNKIMGYQWLAN